MLSTTSTAALCAELHAVQRELYFPRIGLHAGHWAGIHTPDGLSRELKAEIAMRRQRAMFEEWRMSQFLPTDSANDATSAPSAA